MQEVKVDPVTSSKGASEIGDQVAVSGMPGALREGG